MSVTSAARVFIADFVAGIVADIAGILAGADAFDGNVALIRGLHLVADVVNLAGLADCIAGILAGALPFANATA